MATVCARACEGRKNKNNKKKNTKLILPQMLMRCVEIISRQHVHRT